MTPSNHTAQLVRPVSSVTLSEQVANQITDMIATSRWKPGESFRPRRNSAKRSESAAPHFVRL